MFQFYKRIKGNDWERVALSLRADLPSPSLEPVPSYTPVLPPGVNRHRGDFGVAV